MNRYRKDNQASERGNAAFSERHLSERERRHDPSASNRDVPRCCPQARDYLQHYRSTEEDRRSETPREAPESEIPAPNPDVLIAERLQTVDQRIKFVDHDASQARELEEAA